jgi:hypothetical protein
MAGGALCWRQWREVGSGEELALVAVCVNMNGTGVNGTGVNGTGVNGALVAVCWLGRQL